MVFEEAIKCKASTEKAQALAAAVAAGSPLPADGVLEDELESNPLFSKVQPDGRIACKAPNCSKMVSAQNIARYIISLCNLDTFQDFLIAWSHQT